MDILIVDDDPIVLQSCVRILQTEDYNIVTATRVKEALQILKTQTFALILLDIKMPEEDGLALIKNSRERGYEIPILVMSGFSTNETIRSSLESGAHAFISKPFTPDELLVEIEKTIKGKEKADEQ
jgi:DNA-binding NtrC family response regulator